MLRSKKELSVEVGDIDGVQVNEIDLLDATEGKVLQDLPDSETVRQEGKDTEIQFSKERYAEED